MQLVFLEWKSLAFHLQFRNVSPILINQFVLFREMGNRTLEWTQLWVIVTFFKYQQHSSKLHFSRKTKKANKILLYILLTMISCKHYFISHNSCYEYLHPEKRVPTWFRTGREEFYPLVESHKYFNYQVNLSSIRCHILTKLSSDNLKQMSMQN